MDIKQGVIPMIAYEKGLEALEWLTKAFGFKELKRFADKDRLTHGEMDTGNGIIMLATPSPDYQNPKNHRENCEYARKWSNVPWIVDGVLVYVNNIQDHFEKAKRAGAKILTEVEITPHGSVYRCEDIEGHRWMFVQED